MQNRTQSVLGEHSRLVNMGAAWLRRQNFGIVATEITTASTREIPDVIGFRNMCSVVIEAKTSRSDFLRDAAKSHRRRHGLGLYRFFLCPDGLIRPEELPERWGLLYAQGRSAKMIVGPRGNMWPSYGQYHDEHWESFRHEVNMRTEMAVLYSIARRLAEVKRVAA